ncbi:MAG TPA: hypothetical protein VIP75_04805, partial [Acidothermales bacterium]
PGRPRTSPGPLRSGLVGSSGMKRKGRKHLPKVGTPAANAHELHDRREAALHPFAKDPFDRRSGSGYAVMAALVVLVAVVGVVAVLIITA